MAGETFELMMIFCITLLTCTQISLKQDIVMHAGDFEACIHKMVLRRKLGRNR